MKKYKLLQDIPECPAGTIGKLDNASVHFTSVLPSSKRAYGQRYVSYPEYFVTKNSKWFELVNGPIGEVELPGELPIYDPVNTQEIAQHNFMANKINQLIRYLKQERIELLTQIDDLKNAMAQKEV